MTSSTLAPGAKHEARREHEAEHQSQRSQDESHGDSYLPAHRHPTEPRAHTRRDACDAGASTTAERGAPGRQWAVRGSLALLYLLTGCGRLGFQDAVRLDGGGSDSSDPASDTLDSADGTTTSSGITFAQQSPAFNGTGPFTLTLPAQATPGSLLVVTMGANDTSMLVLPGAWTIAQQVSVNGGCFALVAYIANIPPGVQSITFQQPAGLPSVAVLSEFAGVTATALDVTGTNSSSVPAATQSVSTTSATTASGALAVDVFCEDVNNPTYVGASGWTNLGTVSNSSAVPSFSSDFRIVAASGVVTETQTSSLAGKYAATIATFQAQ